MLFREYRSLRAPTIIFVISAAAYAQVPVISLGGVVNAASWTPVAAPGGIIAIFGTNLASVQQSASNVPLPLTLAGTSVMVNNAPAPLYFVSPAQINAQMPASTTGSTARVVVTTAAGSSAPETLRLSTTAPGFFTADQTGCGQASALNIKPDGTVSLNSPSNSAAPGDYIALYGASFGIAQTQPADGSASTAASSVETAPQLFLDGNPIANLSYAGLAPTLVGVDQINFRIPASSRNGCAVPVSSGISPAVTLSIQAGGGHCTDPAIQSWGQVLMNQTTITPAAPAPTSPPQELFSANFYAGPGLQVASAATIFGQSCRIPGYSRLSAGSIQIQPPAGEPILAQPSEFGWAGPTYVQVLPPGFMRHGTYTISGSPGSAVGLDTNIAVGSPIQLQTTLASGMKISESQPLTVMWTGGDTGTRVKITLISRVAGLQTSSVSASGDAGIGSLTIRPSCNSSGVCSFGLPTTTDAEIVVQVLPGDLPIATVPGITLPVQLYWSYTWQFLGLTLEP